ncbi:39S ribosomal protein L53, mitochondrial [Myotis davidii]|uniref:Large ribosomal subunit protein mL53 n=1 Tax=Myotis davidii TaxID=225400 RepID=L5M449_MYODS|nr:39S ribosomal protein L53, mitochondrial [Myotis davidii]
MAAAALARLGLRAVKEVRVQFCPFENNVESTRTFLQAVSREKVRATNLKCSVIVDVRHDGSEPCVDVLFGGLAWGVGREGRQAARAPWAPWAFSYLIHSLLPQETGKEMLTAFASHVQARSAAGSGDPPGAEAGR